MGTGYLRPVRRRDALGGGAFSAPMGFDAFNYEAQVGACCLSNCPLPMSYASLTAPFTTVSQPNGGGRALRYLC